MNRQMYQWYFQQWFIRFRKWFCGILMLLIVVLLWLSIPKTNVAYSSESKLSGLSLRRDLNFKSDIQTRSRSIERPVGKIITKSCLLAIEKIENPSDRYLELGQILKKASPDAAASLLAGMTPGELTGSAATMLYDIWCSKDPRAALEWVRDMGDPKLLHGFISSGALHWGNLNLGEALNWVHESPPGDFRSVAMTRLGYVAVYQNPRQALDIANGLPEGQSRAELIACAAANWARTDLNGSLECALKINDTTIREQALSSIAISASAQDLEAAVSIALDKIGPSLEQDRALVSIALHWANTDPHKAASWVSQFPDDELGRSAVSDIVNIWSKRDIQESAKWISSLPAGHLRNVGIQTYANILEQTDPAMAARWRASVTTTN